AVQTTSHGGHEERPPARPAKGTKKNDGESLASAGLSFFVSARAGTLSVARRSWCSVEDAVVHSAPGGKTFAHGAGRRVRGRWARVQLRRIHAGCSHRFKRPAAERRPHHPRHDSRGPPGELRLQER